MRKYFQSKCKHKCYYTNILQLILQFTQLMKFYINLAQHKYTIAELITLSAYSTKRPIWRFALQYNLNEHKRTPFPLNYQSVPLHIRILCVLCPLLKFTNKDVIQRSACCGRSENDPYRGLYTAPCILHRQRNRNWKQFDINSVPCGVLSYDYILKIYTHANIHASTFANIKHICTYISCREHAIQEMCHVFG